MANHRNHANHYGTVGPGSPAFPMPKFCMHPGMDLLTAGSFAYATSGCGPAKALERAKKLLALIAKEHAEATK